MTDTTKRLKATGTSPYPWVIISRETDAYGYPVYNQHTLAESAQTKAHAVMYAERRAAEGRWVEVYREHYYHAPLRGQTEGQ